MLPTLLIPCKKRFHVPGSSRGGHPLPPLSEPASKKKKKKKVLPGTQSKANKKGNEIEGNGMKSGRHEVGIILPLITDNLLPDDLMI